MCFHIARPFTFILYAITVWRAPESLKFNFNSVFVVRILSFCIVLLYIYIYMTIYTYDAMSCDAFLNDSIIQEWWKTPIPHYISEFCGHFVGQSSFQTNLFSLTSSRFFPRHATTSRDSKWKFWHIKGFQGCHSAVIRGMWKLSGYIFTVVSLNLMHI